MENIEIISSYVRFLKRLNYSRHTVKNYFSVLKKFAAWLNLPFAEATNRKIFEYIDFLLDKELAPKTINGNLFTVRGFYDYLHYELGAVSTNPVKPEYSLRLPRPLPRFLKDEEIEKFFSVIRDSRDQAIFRIMLRCGLRVQEVANLTIGAIDFRNRKIEVRNGKWGRERVVYVSNDAFDAILAYLANRPTSRWGRLFLVQKGTFKNQPISVRGIQKRMEYYSKKSGVSASCHRLRHTMANQLLNADASPVTIQELLGHDCLASVQRYCRASNPKVRRDYFRAIDTVIQRSQARKPLIDRGNQPLR